MCSRLLYCALALTALLGYTTATLADTHETQETNTAASNSHSLADDVIFVGHSLVSPHLPYVISTFISESGGSVQFQVINGAPLKWSWEHSFEAQGVDAREVLRAGDIEALIITEAGVILDHVTWSDSRGYALRWHHLAVKSNPDTRVYLYEIWPGFDMRPDPAKWRAQIASDLPVFEGIVDHVNANRSAGSEMLIIPGGQALARMSEEIDAGRVPGLTDIRELFADDIHLTGVGFYYMAMVHYTAIYGRSPVGLPYQLTDEWGGSMEAPPPELALKMQELAWEVVRAYPRSGVVDDL